ncbi:hypothetical protein KIH74_34720 [Kineosporia sp. J2-2]|uniref:Fe2OG dioxygenase domain-containing protein n=1 Tax=Kineosporia corallincola TaxID=2835133 RepID=A0ABS5TTK7_9ACTN|nr:hypothetical protein [Kineosporia corallincola]MBT0774151.1 hypothetical protein [Kineosporia corallincola]
MIHIAETVGIGSIENFLDEEERLHLAKLMTEVLDSAEAGTFGAKRRTTIHEIPGHDEQQAMAVYEPLGRVEIFGLPEAVENILQAAFERSRPALARVMPSITHCRPWTYVEYGPGQHITSHLDGIAPDPLAWPRQIAGISVVVSEPEAGGGFFIESTSSEQLWNRPLPQTDNNGYADGMWLAHDGADNSSLWFQTMPRTRWSVEPAPGTALLYGSQLAHGTHPVSAGRIGKFISWLAADATAEA